MTIMAIICIIQSNPPPQKKKLNAFLGIFPKGLSTVSYRKTLNTFKKMNAQINE